MKRYDAIIIGFGKGGKLLAGELTQPHPQRGGCVEIGLGVAGPPRPYEWEHMLCAKSELPYSTHTGKD